MALKRVTTAMIKELLGRYPKGLSITQIVRNININRNTAGRYLENLMVSGQVEMRQYGMAKIYRLAQRVPLSAMLSISSELIMLLDNGLRIIYANEPMYRFLGTTQEELYGKNIEFSPCVTVCDEEFDTLKKHLKAGLAGREWSGELSLATKNMVFSCRIAPAVFEEGQRGVSLLLEDITEWKRAEKSLRESEDRYRKLVEISPDAVILHLNEKIMYMNPAALELLGFPQPGEVIGKNVLDLIQPDFRDRVRKNIQIDLMGDRTLPVELQMIRADGTLITVEGRGVRTFIGGQPAVQVAIRDVTERKRAEEALCQSEATARALINAPTDSVLLLDLQGVILDLNDTAARRLGKTKDELIGVLADSVLPEEISHMRRSLISRIIDKKEAVRFEDDRDGIWFDTVAFPVIGANGEVNRIAIIARDITERKRFEEALRQSEGKLNAMLQSITDPMTMMDGDLTLIWANDMARRCFGNDIVGKKCYEAFHQRQNPCEPSPCLTLRAFRDGKIHRHETTVIDIQGKTRFFDCTANVALRDETGRPTAVLEISRDITEWKLAEEALQKRS